MGLAACETNLATFLKMHVFSVRDNNFKTFLSYDFHTSLWYLNRLYEDRKDLCNKFFFETLRAVCAELVILLLHFDEFSRTKKTSTEQSKFEVTQ